MQRAPIKPANPLKSGCSAPGWCTNPPELVLARQQPHPPGHELAGRFAHLLSCADHIEVFKSQHPNEYAQRQKFSITEWQQFLVDQGLSDNDQYCRCNACQKEGVS